MSTYNAIDILKAIKGRTFTEAEEKHRLLNDGLSDAINKIRHSWDKIDANMYKSLYNYYRYCRIFHDYTVEWPEAKEILYSHPKYAYLVAKKEKIKDNVEIEKTLTKDLTYMLRYIRYVLKVPTKRLESYFMEDKYHKTCYLEYVDKYNKNKARYKLFLEKKASEKNSPLVINSEPKNDTANVSSKKKFTRVRK